MNTLTIAPADDTFAFSTGDTLLQILQRYGLVLERPCAGKGTCGKCRVIVASGKVNPATAEEVEHLGEESLSLGIRLACQVIPEGDLTVRLPDGAGNHHPILADGYVPQFNVAPVISKAVFPIETPTLANALSYEQLVKNAVGTDLLPDDPAFLRNLPALFEGNQITAVYAGDSLIGVEGGDSRDRMYGMAVDIGTTTLVASLVDLNAGCELGCETAINPQKEFGLDVLSRIDFAKRETKGLAQLKAVMVDCLNRLTRQLCHANQVSIRNVYEMAVAANATMMHLLLGVSTASIGKAPFATVFSGAQALAAGAIGLELSPFARLYCLPGVSSYIGADIVAGVAVADLKKTRRNVLFLDMGTNCELVLSKGGALSSCSCAAGPALEGMNISCGMRASHGAVQGVKINACGITLDVIGKTQVRGICGSGILEAISEILRTGLMGKNGRIKKKDALLAQEDTAGLAPFVKEDGTKRSVELAEGRITVTQGDIRQVQLAKGAILSGVNALLQFMSLAMEDLDEVIIAGQFGKHLSVDSLIGVGILPKSLGGKIRYIGNSSKTGALMCLLSGEARQDMEAVAKDICYFELATKEGYERLFTKCLMFS